MLKKTFIAIAMLILLFFLFWPQIQYLWFNKRLFNTNAEIDINIYKNDKKKIEDTLMLWRDKHIYSPLAFKPKEWWIDTILYSDDYKRIIIIANAITDHDAGEKFNISKWLAGVRMSSGGVKLVSSLSSLNLLLIDKNISDKKNVTAEGRKYFIKFWFNKYSLSVRKEFWDEIFQYEKEFDEIEKNNLR